MAVDWDLPPGRAASVILAEADNWSDDGLPGGRTWDDSRRDLNAHQELLNAGSSWSTWWVLSRL